VCVTTRDRDNHGPCRSGWERDGTARVGVVRCPSFPVAYLIGLAGGVAAPVSLVPQSYCRIAISL